MLSAVCVGIIAILPAIAVCRESYWIDELHSLWVVHGSWNDLVALAWAGNQTPLYFACLKPWCNIVGYDEPWARSLSMLAWWIAVAMCLFLPGRSDEPSTTNDSHSVTPAALGWFHGFNASTLLYASIAAVWLLLDWTSQFYASEARPYALVAMTTMFLFQSAKGDEERPSEWNWRWTLWSTIAVYLHLTAILVVASHWLGRFVSACRKPIHRSRLRRIRLLELIVWSLCIAPLASQGRHVYERASQWKGMTETLSWFHYVELVPCIPWILVPILVLWLTNHLRHLQESDWQVLWVAILPPGLVGVMALLQVAPLGHRRYVIGAYIATFFFGCIAMMRLRSPWHLALLGMVSCLMSIGIQGNWQTAIHRPFFDWPRQENWREVIHFLNEQAPADSIVYLAPNLVETATVPATDPDTFYWPVTASPSVDTYFEFAIRSQYPLRSDLRCIVLPNDTARWEGILRSRSSAVPALQVAEQRWNRAFVVSRSLECPWLDGQKQRRDFGHVILWGPPP